MNLNELRLGNWVHHKDDWSYRQPEQDFKEFDFQWEDRDWSALGECTLFEECLEPIPLTEEWLVRFGFEKTPDTKESDYKLGFMQLCWDVDDDDWFDWRLFDIAPSSIKYVHQLQNLFFALTGEELTLK